MDEQKKNFLKSVGFEEQVNNINEKKCAWCESTKTKPEDFKDRLSLKEFGISGLCQECQDKIFK